MPETSIAPNDDLGSENLHTECFKYSILAPVFPAQDFSEAIDFDSREWMTNSNNEMKLITEPDKILNILTDSMVLETGLVDNNDEKTAGNVFRYFAKFANRLTILSTSPMRFVRL